MTPYDSLMVLGDQHWVDKRFDLAATEFAAAFGLRAADQAADRAGVMAARSLAALHRPDEARPLLEAVAAADSGGYWWGRALYHHARMTLTWEEPCFAKPADTDAREAEKAQAVERLERAILHFRNKAAADSTWRTALIDAEALLLENLRSVETLDGAFSRAVGEATDDEEEARLTMAYVRGLTLTRSEAFLPEKREIEGRERKERIRRALLRVMRDLGETPHRPEAMALYYYEVGDAEILRELLDQYPDSREAAQAKRESGRALEPAIQLRVPPLVSPVDPVRIDASIRNLARAEIEVIRVSAQVRLRSLLRNLVVNPETLIPLLPEHLRGPHPLRWLPIPWRDPFARRVVNRLKLTGPATGKLDTTCSATLPRGFYELRPRPIVKEHQKSILTVGTLRLYGSGSPDSVHALVTTSDGEAAPRVHVVAYGWRRTEGCAVRVEPIGERLTDEGGFARFPAPMSQDSGGYLLLAWRDQDAACLQLYMYQDDRHQWLLWTDRTIYRPGELVHFQALLLRPPLSHRLPAVSETLRVHAYMPPPIGRPDRSVAEWDSILVTDSFGAARGVLALPVDIADGSLYLSARAAQRTHSFGEQCQVRIAAFERHDFTIQVEPRKFGFAPGDTVIVDVLAETAHGSPLAGARITCMLYEMDMMRASVAPSAHAAERALGRYHPRERRSWWSDSRSRRPFDPATVEMTLDQSGRTTIRIATAPLATRASGWRYPGTRRERAVENDANMLKGLALEVSVDDQAGRHRRAEAEIPLFPESTWCVTEGPDISGRIRVSRLDNQGRPAPGPVHYRWVRLTPDFERDCYVEEMLASGSVPTDDRGSVVLDPPARADSLRVELDVRGESGAQRWTWGRGGPYGPGPRPFGHSRYHIRTLRPAYEVGDTAHIVRSAAFRERPGVLRVGNPGEGGFFALWPAGRDSLFSLPVLENYLPRIEVAYSVADGDRGPLSTARTWVEVEPTSRLLSVEVRPGRPTYGPGDSVEVVVEVRDASGQPVEAVLSVAVVDREVFAFAEDTMDLKRVLFRTLYRERAALSPPAPARVEAAAIVLPRTTLRPTAFWRAGVTTEASTGKAVLRAKAPDDLARWRVTVRAVDRDGRVGQGVAAFSTEHGLELRPRLPRFARSGDRFTFGTLIENRTDEPHRFRVSWTARALRGIGPRARELRIEAGTIGEARFDATAQEAGADSVTIAVEVAPGRGPGRRRPDTRLADAVQLALPVHPRDLPAPPSEEERDRVRSRSLAQIVVQTCGRVEQARAEHRRRDVASHLAMTFRCLRGAELLAEDEAAGIPRFAPDPDCIDDLRCELTACVRETSAEEDKWEPFHNRIRDALRLLYVLEEAEKLDWWHGERRARRRLADWLAKQAESPLLAPDERAQVANALQQIGKGVSSQLLDRLWEEREALSPGGQGILALLVGDAQPERAQALVLGATGYACFDVDTTYAHFVIPGSRQSPHARGRSRWRLQPEESAAYVLLALAKIAPANAMAQAIANGLVIRGESRGWAIDPASGPILDALVEFARARDSLDSSTPLNRIPPGSEELRIERRVQIGSEMGGDRGPEVRGTEGDTPDTLACGVGDSLRVTLAVHSRASLFGLVVEDPTPAGCQELGAEFPYGGRRTVRDDAVVFSFEGAYEPIAPGELVLNHVLIAVRPGAFHLPAARAYPARLPELEGRSRPLVVRVDP